jgi:hypothetical protein
VEDPLAHFAAIGIAFIWASQRLSQHLAAGQALMVVSITGQTRR